MIETDDCECTVIHEDVVVGVRKQIPLSNRSPLRRQRAAANNKPEALKPAGGLEGIT
jgi:hypothetical protein